MVKLKEYLFTGWFEAVVLGVLIEKW